MADTEQQHYIPAISLMPSGTTIIDHFGVPYMAVAESMDSEKTLLINLKTGVAVGSHMVACPWVYVDRSEVQL